MNNPAMFTKKMLKRLMAHTPRNATCYVVVGGVALEIKGVVSSHTLGPNHAAPRLWFVAGGVAPHQPPLEIHHPIHWLNRKHNAVLKGGKS